MSLHQECPRSEGELPGD